MKWLIVVLAAVVVLLGASEYASAQTAMHVHDEQEVCEGFKCQQCNGTGFFRGGNDNCLACRGTGRVSSY